MACKILKIFFGSLWHSFGHNALEMHPALAQQPQPDDETQRQLEFHQKEFAFSIDVPSCFKIKWAITQTAQNPVVVMDTQEDCCSCCRQRG